jgi:hypothetical protein
VIYFTVIISLFSMRLKLVRFIFFFSLYRSCFSIHIRLYMNDSTTNHSASILLTSGPEMRSLLKSPMA